MPEVKLTLLSSKLQHKCIIPLYAFIYFSNLFYKYLLISTTNQALFQVKGYKYSQILCPIECNHPLVGLEAEQTSKCKEESGPGGRPCADVEGTVGMERERKEEGK